jgi:nucleoside-diphosphate-sugar epimerase
MSKGQILITGVNGFIAARCAKFFLDQGYSVRGTVRNLQSAKPLLGEALKAYAENGKFEVVEVPDITNPGAFDEAVKGELDHIQGPIIVDSQTTNDHLLSPLIQISILLTPRKESPL